MVQKNYLSLGSISYGSIFLLLLAALGIISNGALFVAFNVEAASPTKIVVTLVNHDGAYFSGTTANVDKSIVTTGVQTQNPATFYNILAGTHTVSVSKKYSCLTLRNFKMCTYPDVNTICTPNVSVSFTCTDTECKTSPIAVGARPIKVQAQYSSMFPVR